MIIILPIRLDGVGFSLWHEKVFVEHGWVRPNDHHKYIWFQWSRLKVSPPHSMRGTWMGKTLMIIILPIRLDGVGFSLWHEKVFVEHGWVRPNDHHKYIWFQWSRLKVSPPQWSRLMCICCSSLRVFLPLRSEEVSKLQKMCGTMLDCQLVKVWRCQDLVGAFKFPCRWNRFNRLRVHGTSIG